MTTGPAFAALLDWLSASAGRGDGAAFAACFTEDAVYHDYIYGPHRGRAGIAQMLTGLFHRDAREFDWQFFDPVTDGRTGYAKSLSRFRSAIPEFEGREVVIGGISRFDLHDGLIARYSESVNAGIAMVQLGVQTERMAKVMRRWADALLAEDAVKAYAAAARARCA